MLEVLRKKLKIPEDKFFNDIRYTGNTVSSSIPIALQQLIKESKFTKRNEIIISRIWFRIHLGGYCDRILVFLQKKFILMDIQELYND